MGLSREIIKTAYNSSAMKYSRNLEIYLLPESSKRFLNKRLIRRQISVVVRMRICHSLTQANVGIARD